MRGHAWREAIARGGDGPYRVKDTARRLHQVPSSMPWQPTCDSGRTGWGLALEVEGDVALQVLFLSLSGLVERAKAGAAKDRERRSVASNRSGAN